MCLSLQQWPALKHFLFTQFRMFGWDFRVPVEQVLPIPDEDWDATPEMYGVEQYVNRLDKCL